MIIKSFLYFCLDYIRIILSLQIIIIIIIMDLQATDVTKICKPKVRRQNRT